MTSISGLNTFRDSLEARQNGTNTPSIHLLYFSVATSIEPYFLKRLSIVIALDLLISSLFGLLLNVSLYFSTLLLCFFIPKSDPYLLIKFSIETFTDFFLSSYSIIAVS